MSESKRDMIVNSPTAKRMLSRVSPIYDNSYVGLWLFEAIAREYDALWTILDDLPNQLYPGTATWALELWERRYGLPIPSASTIELRRINIQLKRSARPPMNPARLESIIEAITGKTAQVNEHIGAYTFELRFSAASGEHIRQIREMVNRLKPSHLSYNMVNTQYHTVGYYLGGCVARRKSLVYREVQ